MLLNFYLVFYPISSVTITLKAAPGFLLLTMGQLDFPNDLPVQNA